VLIQLSPANYIWWLGSDIGPVTHLKQRPGCLNAALAGHRESRLGAKISRSAIGRFLPNKPLLKTMSAKHPILTDDT